MFRGFLLFFSRRLIITTLASSFWFTLSTSKTKSRQWLLSKFKSFIIMVFLFALLVSDKSNTFLASPDQTPPAASRGVMEEPLPVLLHLFKKRQKTP